MQNTIQKILRLLLTTYRWQSFFIIMLLIINGIVSGFSIVAVIPLINFATETVPNDSSASNLFNEIFIKLNIEPSVYAVLIFVLLLFVVKAIVTVAADYISNLIRVKTEIEKRKQLYKQSLNTKVTKLYKINFGRLANIIINETRMIGMLIDYMTRYLTAIVQLLAYISVLVFVSAELTFITAGTALLIYLLIRPIFITAQKLGHKITTINSKVQEQVNYSLVGYKTIKAYVMEALLNSNMNQMMSKFKSLNMRLALTESSFKSIFEPIVFLVIVLVYPFVELDVAVYIAFIVALARMYQAFQGIQNMHYKMAKHVPSLNIYDVIYSEIIKEQYKEDQIEGLDFETIETDIALKDIKYSYKSADDNFVLGPLNLEIPKNSTVGFVGASGSGKSTVANIIEGFISPDSGSVLFNNISIDSYKVKSIRNKVGYVSQDLFLLNDTIEKNILFGRDYSEKDIRNASKLSFSDSFISQLPQGYKTIIGEQGTRLSGGQKQRLSLARALIGSPQLLILDEATSSLDNESEKEVMRAINNLRGKITKLIIAHRLGTVINSDIIYVFDEGRIVESGSFNELLKNKARFYDLYHQEQK